jgi:hypothetical protein
LRKLSASIRLFWPPALEVGPKHERAPAPDPQHRGDEKQALHG